MTKVCTLLSLATLLPPAAAAQAPQTPRVAEVQVAPAYLRMLPDAQTQVSATAYDTSGSPLTVKFRWSSSNMNVAAVDSAGMVRAVAPGQALVTATPLVAVRGRRRVGQITVRVVPPATGETQIGPAPSMPATPTPPGAHTTPRVPPMGPVMVVPRMTDSMMKASINCTEPMINSVNPLRACYDERPRSRTRLSLLNTTSCPGQHGGVMLMVRVSETGSVSEVRPYVHSRCPDVTDSIIAAARQLTFSPALKDGQAVPAWVRIQVQTGPASELPPPHPEPPKP